MVVLSRRPSAARRSELQLPGGTFPIPVLPSSGVQCQAGCESCLSSPTPVPW